MLGRNRRQACAALPVTGTIASFGSFDQSHFQKNEGANWWAQALAAAYFGRIAGRGAGAFVVTSKNASATNRYGRADNLY
ncbi:hypothetical protein C0Z17_18120 [Trinickia caryophylli]|nr:hypothetical protein C0Z17_18120 [Trinickia caryophylli]